MTQTRNHHAVSPVAPSSRMRPRLCLLVLVLTARRVGVVMGPHVNESLVPRGSMALKGADMYFPRMFSVAGVG